jgi:hypothetical protein
MPAQEPKPGFQTTEFWVVILTALLPLLTLIFHKDFTNQVQTWATAAAGLATVIYIISRSFVKSAYARAQTNASAKPGDAATAGAATKSGDGAVPGRSAGTGETPASLADRVRALEERMADVPVFTGQGDPTN